MKQTLILLCTLLAATSACAAIIEVPGDTTTIQAAHNIASPGDTILVGAGTFIQNITFSKRIAVLGAGIQLSSLLGLVSLNSGCTGTIIEGINMEAARQFGGIVEIAAGVDSISLRRVRIRNTFVDGAANCVKRTGPSAGVLNLHGCVLQSSGADNDNRTYLVEGLGDILTISCTIFAGNNNPSGWTHALGGTFSGMALYNCIFTGFQRPFYTSGSFAMTISNSTFYDWTSAPAWGLFPPSATIDYNASTASPGPIGTNFITLTANPFVNYNETNNYQYGVSDLRLNTTPGGGALCVDAGVPAILDLDGSRSDLGIYGGMNPFLDNGAPNYPFVEFLTVPAAITSGQDLQINAVGRIGRGY